MATSYPDLWIYRSSLPISCIVTYFIKDHLECSCFWLRWYVWPCSSFSIWVILLEVSFFTILKASFSLGRVFASIVTSLPTFEAGHLFRASPNVLPFALVTPVFFITIPIPFVLGVRLQEPIFLVGS